MIPFHHPPTDAPLAITGLSNTPIAGRPVFTYTGNIGVNMVYEGADLDTVVRIRTLAETGRLD